MCSILLEFDVVIGCTRHVEEERGSHNFRKPRQNLFSKDRCRKLSPVRDDEMGTALQQTDYQCDQCGATNIVAASVIYSQGTHSFSRRFSAGTTQSSSARAAAPPRARGYFRPFL